MEDSHNIPSSSRLEPKSLTSNINRNWNPNIRSAEEHIHTGSGDCSSKGDEGTGRVSSETMLTLSLYKSLGFFILFQHSLSVLSTERKVITIPDDY